MTRLTTNDIDGLGNLLIDYDRELMEKIGLDMMGLACLAAGLDKIHALEIIRRTKAGVASLTCGEGVIPGFSESLSSIAEHLGFPSRASAQTDAAGLADLIAWGADIILTADDNRYVALNLNNKQVADNDLSTGRIFAFALDRLARGLSGKSATVLGCGPVGRHAATSLLELGAIVTLYDPNERRTGDFVALLPATDRGPHIAGSFDQAVIAGAYVLDATPVPDILTDSYMDKIAGLAAPGVPCGVAGHLRRKYNRKIIHDPLQLGTALMLIQAIKP